MFLRSLTLRGFKSFATKTTLQFAPGISAIVGPNGSGKSNTVDAIAWVLGEQGPRALRGGQMSDVIFAGSPDRPALGMAEVTLVIDNSAALIPVDVSEIEISRVVYRSGESQYLIGGKPVRLMDIQELLSDTGIGRALHTVVGQGQLEEVLTARPEERRAFIEEAAGIAKHRKRKERAQRKLAGLEHDLLRLQDVMAELRRQLKPLKQQAASAEKHRALTEQADELSWRMAAARLRDLHRFRDTRRSGWDEGRSRRQEAENKLKALDQDIAALGERLSATERTLREAEQAEDRAIEARSDAEHTLRGAVQAEGEARARLAAESGRSGRLFSLEEEARTTRDALEQAVTNLAEKEGLLAEADRAHAAAEQARRDAEEERRLSREASARILAEADSLRRTLITAEAEHERLTTALEEATARLEEAVAGRGELRSETERLHGDEAPVRALAEARAQAEALVNEIRDLEAQDTRAQARLEALAARRADAGATPGKRFLQRRKRTATGLLGELVRIKGGMEAAVAAALGSLADAVVYEDHDRAVAEAEGADGATLVVAASDAQPRTDQPLSGERRLLDVVDADPRVARLVETALRHVYLAEDPAGALRKHRAHPEASFVTPEGILVGRRVVRTAPSPGRIAEELRHEEEELDRDRSRLRSRLTERRREQKAAGAHVEAAERALREAEGQRSGAAERLAWAEAEAAAAERERDLIADRLARADETVRATRDAMARLPEEPAELPALPPLPEPPMDLRVEVEALRRERARLETGLSRATAELDRLRGEDPASLAARAQEAETFRREAEAALAAAEEAVTEAAGRREEAAAAAADARSAEVGTNERWREAASLLQRLRDEYEEDDQARRDVERRIAEASRVLSEGHGRDPEEAVAALAEDDTVDVLQKGADLVARRLTLLGRVNLVAGEEFHALQERHDFLQREIDDVRAARRDLQQVIREVDRKIVEVYEAAYQDVAAEFERMFTTVFPGGEGRLVAVEGEDPLTSGVDIHARPGRKKVKRLSLLSGGERALTALAFLFAIFKARPSPFYLLDEVEAALDDVNLHRFIQLIRDFAREAQVIVVTHQKRTMEAADVLYGVSMGRDGVSAVITQRVSEAVPATPADA